MPYTLREGQEPQVEIPTRCIWSEDSCDKCDVRRKGRRHRETGPCHSLTVVKCHHGPAFTLYPPGYGRYDRTPVAPTSSSGEVVRVGPYGDSEKQSGGPAWERSVHSAALDASRGESWPRESPASDPRRRRTQRRYIVVSATLLGLSAELEEWVVQRIANCLGIAYLVLLDLRCTYKAAPTYQGRGAAIVSVLELIPVDRTLAHRMLMAGFLGGLWGRPARWDPG